MWLILIAILSYFLGSIPFSYFVAKAYGKNLFEIGSKNIGVANVFRATGRIEAMILALIGDVGKGFFSVYFAQRLSFLGYNLLVAQALAAFFVVLGHNWSIFLKFAPLEKPTPAISIGSKIRNFLTGFKGGRGLAPLAGVILFLNWKVIILALIVIGFFIFITELIMKKGLKLEGSLKEKIKRLFSIFISQILGRVIGIVVVAILVYVFYPQLFKILFGATVLTGIRHIKRTEDFLKK